MSRLRLLSGPRVGWHPLDLAPALRPLYLSALDQGGLLVQSGGVVTSWTGRQGGLAFTAAGSPAYSATGLAGAYPLVSGDGVGAYLNAESTTGLPGSTDPLVIAGLVNIRGGAQGRVLTFGGTSGSNSRRMETTVGGNAQIASGSLAATGAIDTDLRPRIMVGVFTATTAFLRIDGTEVDRMAGTLPANGTTRTRLFAGSANTPANFLAGGITELLIGTTWTARQIEQFEGYCAHAFPAAGIVLPDSHPYVRAAP